MTVLYGLRNCDTCRKAWRLLDALDIDYTFRDLRADPVDEPRIRAWLDAAGAATLVNRRSTTWRQLAEEERQRVETDPAALLCAHPTLIRRPILEPGNGQVLVGYREADYRAALGNSP